MSDCKETMRLLQVALAWGETEVPNLINGAAGADADDEDGKWLDEPAWFAEARALLGKGTPVSEPKAAGPVFYRDRHYVGRGHLASPDPSRPGKWRASRVDVLGPFLHTEAEDRDAAMETAVANGADPATARELTLAAVDAILALDLDLYGAACERRIGAAR